MADKSQKSSIKFKVESKASTSPKINYIELAMTEQDGFTLIATGKIKGNSTVELFKDNGKTFEIDGMSVCKYKG